MTIQPHDFSARFYSQWRFQTINIGSLLLALALVAGGYKLPPNQKTLMLTGALVAVLGGKVASNGQTDEDRIALDYGDISAAARQQNLYEDMVGAGATTGAGPVLNLMPGLGEALAIADDDAATNAFGIPMYDLTAIAGENHTAVIGASGSGKTYLTQYLATRYFGDAEVRAMDIDAAPTDWPGLKVIGNGGNIRAIQRQMNEDCDELQRRVQLRSVGKPVGGSLVRVVEELPTLTAEIGEELAAEVAAAMATGDRGFIAEAKAEAATNVGNKWLKLLARRGRKYGMKIFMVSQEFSVKALDIEGEGGLRRAFTVIYLGAEAIAQLPQIKDKAEREKFAKFLEAQNRPALVWSAGNWLGVEIPDLSNWNPALSVATLAEAAAVGDDIVDSIAGDEYDDDFGDDPTTYAAASASSAVATVVEAQPPETSKTLHSMISAQLAAGVTKTKIIKEQWGLVGARYAEGKALWDELIRLYGDFNA